MTIQADEKRRALVTGCGGPVVSARSNVPLQLNEAIRVGPESLLGEIVRLDGNELVAQVYEDTTGLRPGDWLFGTGGPLSVSLGPGLLGGIFDGLLRPLTGGGSFVERGERQRQALSWRFEPMLKRNDTAHGGDRIGKVTCENQPAQYVLVPPRLGGTVDFIAEPGEWPEDACICRLRTEGHVLEIGFFEEWPVRLPRPVGERLRPSVPLITGQRLIDTFFPVARGGRAGMPGGFGTGKTILQQSIAKWCDADIIIYVGCGERGNEMTEVLREFPDLDDPRTGHKLMERSVIIANTSNMPVAAREASIYTGVTVAEFFRDQGFDVALMADSTSRWAEALREISGRLGELPAEGGYPAYLGSRKAEFYERAGHVKTLSGEPGSVTLIGAVSPPGGDFSEPVTLYTERNVRCYWPLDRDRARARFYPAINPLQAYSEDVEDVADWWRREHYPDYLNARRRLITLLQDQSRLQRMARIVGKDALPPEQRLTLLCAELVDEGFLRQNAFSEKDGYATPGRQAKMMQTLSRFIDHAETALASGVSIEEISSLN
ncbi:MAG: V-type ATP synthase subunit A, partial [Pseudomonadales bacterium]|nr:V-type ATP synthase subunit A [Pseudomonadales bacterium]